MPNIFHNFREKINKEKEKDNAIFRYDDLTIEAQKKFVRLIKNYSSIYTIRKYTEEEIHTCLDMANPKITRANPWRKGFGGDIKKWEEKEISRIIYKLNKKRPNTNDIEYITFETETHNND